MESGLVTAIDTRGRITIDLVWRKVFADVCTGGGASVGDRLEGDMTPGRHIWRHAAGNRTLAVQVISAEARRYA